MSLVSGFEDIFAAVAKELNATSTCGTFILVRRLAGGRETPTRNASPERCVECLYERSSEFNRSRVGREILTVQIPIFLSILSSSSFRTNKTRRRNACSQAYNLMLDSGNTWSASRGIDPYSIAAPPNIRQQFAHQARTLVLRLHLLYLKIFQEICDHRIQWDGKDHDGNPHKRGPSEKVVQRDERERDLFETPRGQS